MTEERPSWLKRMENGEIGESRARCLLLDRFWILERSVDVHGADFLIQRRLLQQSILDSTPPRFGLVQAKFFQSDTTRHFVPKEYLVDKNGMPMREFFLLCFTGYEEGQSEAFMTADQVLSQCRCLGPQQQNADRFELRWDVVFSTSNRQPRSRILNRIDERLQHADLKLNRKYFFNLQQANFVNPATDPEFEDPIDNPFGPVPHLFQEFKKQVEHVAWHAKHLCEELGLVIASTNPQEALKLLSDAYSSADTLQIMEELGDRELKDAVEHHAIVRESLSRIGVLGEFIALQRAVEDEIVRRCADLVTVPRGQVRLFTVSFDLQSLCLESSAVEVVDAQSITELPDVFCVCLSEPGRVAAFTGDSFKMKFRRGRHGKQEEMAISDTEHTRGSVHLLSRPIMDEVYKHLIGFYPWDQYPPSR